MSFACRRSRPPRPVPPGRGQRARLRGRGARRRPVERGGAAVQRRPGARQPGLPRRAQLRAGQPAELTLIDEPGLRKPETRAVGANCGGIRVWSLYAPNGRTPESGRLRLQA